MSDDIGSAAAVAALNGRKVITLNGRKYCLYCYKNEHRTTSIRQTVNKDLYNCPVCMRLYKDIMNP